MKRLHLWIGLGLVVVVGFAISMALQMGEKSPIYAAGQISLTPDLTNDAKGIRTLFIILYDGNGSSPMPYGAMRETIDSDAAGDFFKFSITKERLNVMNPERRVPHLFRVKARLDVDGTAGMDTPGDLTGVVDTVPMGATDVHLVIDKKAQ